MKEEMLTKYKITNKYQPEHALVDTPTQNKKKVGINLLSKEMLPQP
jgi:hypothetical protein